MNQIRGCTYCEVDCEYPGRVVEVEEDRNNDDTWDEEFPYGFLDEFPRRSCVVDWVCVHISMT